MSHTLERSLTAKYQRNWLSPEETAASLYCKPDYILNAINLGHLRAANLNGGYRILTKNIIEYMEKYWFGKTNNNVAPLQPINKRRPAQESI